MQPSYELTDHRRFSRGRRSTGADASTSHHLPQSKFDVAAAAFLSSELSSLLPITANATVLTKVRLHAIVAMHIYLFIPAQYNCNHSLVENM